MKIQFLEVGKIVGTHGIAGEMRVQPWCDSPKFLTKFKTLYKDKNGQSSLNVRSARVHKNVVLLKVEGVDSIESAERMRNQVLYISRDDANIPNGEWFVQELINCSVFDADDGSLLGVLSDISQTGANDVWHVEKDGKEYLVPAIKDVVVSVDIDAEKIVIRPIKGIFDEI